MVVFAGQCSIDLRFGPEYPVAEKCLVPVEFLTALYPYLPTLAELVLGEIVRQPVLDVFAGQSSKYVMHGAEDLLVKKCRVPVAIISPRFLYLPSRAYFEGIVVQNGNIQSVFFE